MRLIDADAVLAALSIFNDTDDGIHTHFMNGIKTAREVIADAPMEDAVQIKPLAKWLAGYAMPPGGLLTRNTLNTPDATYAELLAESWVDFLREMDWEADE